MPGAPSSVEVGGVGGIVTGFCAGATAGILSDAITYPISTANGRGTCPHGLFFRGTAGVSAIHCEGTWDLST